MKSLADFRGPGLYYVSEDPRRYRRYVCLNCTAYFRTKAGRTQIDAGTHIGVMKVRFCPCCGEELKYSIRKEDLRDDGQMTLDLKRGVA